MWWIAVTVVVVVVAAVVVWRRWDGRNSGASSADRARPDGTHLEAETYANLHRNQTWQSGGPF